MKKIPIVLSVFLTVILFLFFSSGSISGCNKTAPKLLDVYIWDGYLPDEVIALFEKESGIELNISLIADNERMMTLLKAGGKADVIMPTQSYVNIYYETGTVQPLNMDIITNYGKVSENLREQPWTKWDGSQMGSGEVYAVPYIFGTHGLIVNTSKVTKNLDDIGWEILFDTEFKNRVSTKDGTVTLWMVLDMLGIPMENLIIDTNNTLEKTRPKITELKHNVLKFWKTGSEIMDLIKNEEVWVSLAEDGHARKLVQYDGKIQYVLPKNGGLGWADTFMVSKNSLNPDGASIFIDFMLRPDIAALVMEKGGYNTTVKGAVDVAENLNKNLYSYTDEQLAKLVWTPNLPQDARNTVLSFWEEVSSAQ